MMDFHLILTAPNPRLFEAFRYYFEPFGKDVTIDKRYFQHIETYDCLVSPANSFGKMDGGMDADIVEFFGYDLENKVQEEIIHQYGSYQPVGTSMIVETGHPNFPFIAHTPTMFLPEDIQGTIQPYFAFKALLLAINQHNRTNRRKIERVVCPGFGTGVGNMDPDVAAKQMALAYEFVQWSRYVKQPLQAFQQEKEWLQRIR